MTMTRTAEMITRPRLQHSHRSPTPQGRLAEHRYHREPIGQSLTFGI
jgi:hypothetical protein